MEKYDFLILGSGITGLKLASDLRKKGFTTLNLDRSMDLGYPVSGSCFISLKAYNDFFSPYEKYTGGIFSSIIIEMENSEEEISLASERKIVTMDREKLVRKMASELSEDGGNIHIASIIRGFREESEGTVRVSVVTEGKENLLEAGKIILATSNVDTDLLKHGRECIKGFTGSLYSRSTVVKSPEEKFSVSLKEGGIRVEAIYLGKREILEINQVSSKVSNMESIFKYSTVNHSCFPETESFIYMSGNMLGTKNYLGTGLEYSIKFNNHMIENIDQSDLVPKLKEKFRVMNLEKDFSSMDPVDSILYRIPIFS